MVLAGTATDQDRLPWLKTERRRRRRDPRPLLIALFALAALLSAAGMSFWFGRQSVDGIRVDGSGPAGQAADQSVSRELPPVLPEPPVEEKEEPPALAPPVAELAEARPSATPPKEPAPGTGRAAVSRPVARRPPARRIVPRPPPAPPPPIVRERRGGYWPTPATAVRLGRVIQIGVFPTERRADDAWRKTLRRYPQTQGLPRISSAYRSDNGRTYYRVQIMTTAPAQSQWLCRRMRADRRRCIVVGSAA